MVGIYLAAFKAYHPGYDIVYQDINGLRDIGGDMLNISLDAFDYIIATPPCNFYSKANHNPSRYALETAHLLPDILNKLRTIDKPFIVENVRNLPKFESIGITDLPDVAMYFIGRHTYWTNILFNSWVDQYPDYIAHKRHDPNTQGGQNVHLVIERWLKEIHYNNYYKLPCLENSKLTKI